MSKEIEVNAVVVIPEPGDIILVRDEYNDERMWSIGEVTEVHDDGISYIIRSFSNDDVDEGNQNLAAFVEPEDVLGLITDLQTAEWMVV